MKISLLEAIKILKALKESKAVMEELSGGSCLVSVIEALKILEKHAKKKK